MKTLQQGFTLVELMIVVAIIGILASIAIPAYVNYSNESSVNACFAEITPGKLLFELVIGKNAGSAASITSPDNIGLNSTACTSITVAGDVDGSGTIVGNLTIGGVAGTVTHARDTSGDWTCTAGGSAVSHPAPNCP